MQNGHATASVSAPGRNGLVRALEVDRRTGLLHPHVRAAGAAAERLLAAALHLDRLADHIEQLPRLHPHVVVAREIAAVVVRDRLRARGRFQAAVVDELGEQLGVMQHLVVAAEVAVLVRKRVEAMRTARDDLLDTLLVQRRHVLLRVCLEHVLVAHAPRGIAGARLARPEDREVDARLLQQLRGRSALFFARSSNEAAQPTQ